MYLPEHENERLPLISCIMPTHNRRHFIPKAIEYFLRQDYPERELIIMDDSTEPFEVSIPNDRRIRYFRSRSKSTVGEKRNLACEEARGEIIAHWDDDDWMAERRLSYQVKSLLDQQADLCGLNRLLFLDVTSGQSRQYCYLNRQKPWVAGGTLCYTKDFWGSNHFPALNVGEDTRFVWSDRSKKVLVLPDHKIYIAVIHRQNTSTKRTGDPQWRSYPAAEIKKMMGKDWAFYTDHRDAAQRPEPQPPAHHS